MIQPANGYVRFFFTTALAWVAFAPVPAQAEFNTTDCPRAMSIELSKLLSIPAGLARSIKDGKIVIHAGLDERASQSVYHACIYKGHGETPSPASFPGFDYWITLSAKNPASPVNTLTLESTQWFQHEGISGQATTQFRVLDYSATRVSLDPEQEVYPIDVVRPEICGDVGSCLPGERVRAGSAGSIVLTVPFSFADSSTLF